MASGALAALAERASTVPAPDGTTDVASWSGGAVLTTVAVVAGAVAVGATAVIVAVGTAAATVAVEVGQLGTAVGCHGAPGVGVWPLISGAAAMGTSPI